MSEKLNKFENIINDLITETFSTEAELDEAIEWVHTSTLADMLEQAKEYRKG